MDEPQRILVVAGYSKSLLNFRGALMYELVTRGHTVIAVAPHDEYVEEVGNALTDIGVCFDVVPMARSGLKPWQDWLSFRALVRLIRIRKPDVVFAYTAKAVIYSGMAIHKRSRIRFFPMITGLGYAFTEGSSIKRRIVGILVRRLYQRGLASANTVIFQNPDDEGLFRALKLLSESTLSTRVHGSGVDLAKFPPKPLPNRAIFLMLARLLVDKGVREYVDAARQVKQLYPNAVFCLAGSLDPSPASIDSTELCAWAKEGIVEYLGSLQSVQSALAACRFYVLPSYREGTPRSVLEALAMGRPVITTDVPGCRETVVNGKNGLLVSPRDVHALASAMVKLMETSEADIQKMANASLAMAREKYDVKKVNAEILKAMGL